MKENIIEASVIRKPNGTPLCVEILLTPDQVYIPASVETIDYNFLSEDNKKTLIFRLQGGEESE
jgi:hypothetical protein